MPLFVSRISQCMSLPTRCTCWALTTCSPKSSPRKPQLAYIYSFFIFSFLLLNPTFHASSAAPSDSTVSEDAGIEQLQNTALTAFLIEITHYTLVSVRVNHIQFSSLDRRRNRSEEIWLGGFSSAGCIPDFPVFWIGGFPRLTFEDKINTILYHTLPTKQVQTRTESSGNR